MRPFQPDHHVFFFSGCLVGSWRGDIGKPDLSRNASRMSSHG